MTTALGTTWPALVGVVVVILATAIRRRPRPRPRRVQPLDSGSADTSARSNVVSAIRLRTRRLRSTMERRRPAGPADLARWIDDVSRSVGHGRTLRHALLEVSPTVPRVHLVTTPLRLALDRGATIADASARWIARCEAADAAERRRLAMTASILGITSTVGGSVTQPLDRLAAALRSAAADDLERAAHTAQARISVRVLTFVPFAVLALLVTFDDDVRRVCATPLGAALVGGGVALNLLGAWWMRAVIAGRRS